MILENDRNQIIFLYYIGGHAILCLSRTDLQILIIDERDKATKRIFAMEFNKIKKDGGSSMLVMRGHIWLHPPSTIKSREMFRPS